jgi:hypothetical protein
MPLDGMRPCSIHPNSSNNPERRGRLTLKMPTYWHVEQSAVAVAPEHDPLIQEAIHLGGVMSGVLTTRSTIVPIQPEPEGLLSVLNTYLDTVHLIADNDKRSRLQANLLTILTSGVQADDDTFTVMGLADPAFNQYPIHTETLIRHVRNWLKAHHFVFSGCEQEVAVHIVQLARQTLGMGNSQTANHGSHVLESHPLISVPSPQSDRTTDKPQPKRHRVELAESMPLQLVLF